MKTGKLIAINTVVFLIVIAVGIVGINYYQNTVNYISTDNAKVSGDMVPVTVVNAGKITDWTATVGQQVTENEAIGKITGTSTTSITSPIAGTIVQSKGMKGETVAPGQSLAQVVDLSKLYVIANIEETEIKNVSIGQDVDVIVDVDKGTTISGKVTEIGKATNSEFSLLPSQNASGDYTKEVEYVPVKIELESYSAQVVPGMNATVNIHR
ncbi:efflux RND transporter periplasmic adaptor subunit [Shimazuella sp. AN120528]|uniref:HlyD family efflux transporter periplasmic adaptor subunit n=1 Tax=Shimazuella soli TaxID=1892854 RepID=UPI001F0EC43B|nr:HlyD family efflux transporter periplasmic adaptor subunit [Shimazuella soli]MCH5585365.1 efflux RND transporter periplasmic adaptor subunit [Shimazuella soli]